jgi:malate dehydrogenase (oxaloacetate-decarboxylating)
MFLAAAQALADEVTDEMLERGQLYPDISDVRTVSYAVAIAVATEAIAEGVADPIDDLEAAMAWERWEPEYLAYRPAGD